MRHPQVGGRNGRTLIMALFRHGTRIADDWTFPAEGEALPGTGPVALPKARLIAEWPALETRNAPLGVVIASGEKLDGLEDILPRLSLVKLVIPRYADGRLYSIARLLRDRHSFAGEIRASGDVLRDQVALLARAGVDAFDVAHEGTARAIETGSIVAVSHHYQPASNDAAEAHAAAGARPWLRRTPIPSPQP
jgi:phosphoadenosine phosphosulfate reductase